MVPRWPWSEELWFSTLGGDESEKPFNTSLQNKETLLYYCKYCPNASKHFRFHIKNLILLLLSPRVQPHVGESRQACSSLQVNLDRQFLPLGIHPVDIEVMSSLLAPSSLGTLVKECSYTFTDSCTWTNFKKNLQPSTAMHSSNTCPEVRAKGFARRPLHAGHQIWRV